MTIVRFRVAAALAAAAVGSAHVAGAQGAAAPPRPFHVGVAAGATVPLSDPVTFPSDPATGGLMPALGSETGFHAAGFFGYARPSSPLGVRVEFTYHTLRGDDFRFSDPSFGSISLRPDLRLMAGTVQAVLAPTTGAGARPYLIAGVGAYATRTTFHAGGSLIEDVVGSATSVRQSDTSPGVNGGIGVRFALGGVGAFAEARLHYVFNEKRCDLAGTEPCLPRDNTAVAPISFGLMF